MDPKDSFKKPNPVGKTPKTALSKMKKHKESKKKVVNEHSIMLDEDFGVITPPDNPKMDEDPEDEWIYTADEKRLPIEAIQNDDSVNFGLSNDRVDAREINTVRLLKRYNINQASLWRYTTENKGKPFAEYPTEWTGNCIHCHRPYVDPETGKKWIPIFPPDDYDEKNKCWILEMIPLHLDICAKGRIVESSCSNKERKLGLLTRFVREFFKKDLIAIHYIPLSYVIDYNPIGGKLTWEEYEKLATHVDGLLKKLPFMVNDTFVELVDSEQNEKNNRAHFEEIVTMKPTEEQQNNYTMNVERVVKDRKSNSSSLKDSKIAQKLGMIFKKN